MVNRIGAIALVVLAVAVVVLATRRVGPARSDREAGHQLTVGSTPLTVEVVRTQAERQRGLSGRASLAPEAGMLFVFPASDRYGLWMPDMQFPLDLMWIDEQWRVADITEGVTPDTYPQVFQPRVPVRYVLEVNAGWVRRHGVEVGAVVAGGSAWEY